MTTKTIRNGLSLIVLATALGTAGVVCAAPMAPTTHQESMKRAASDSWITTKVKTEFATHRGVDFSDISVTTKHGVVVLTGRVDSQAEKGLAERLAADVKGVKSVEDSGLKVHSDRS